MGNDDVKNKMGNDDHSHISAFLMGFRRVRGLISKRFDISSKVLTYFAFLNHEKSYENVQSYLDFDGHHHMGPTQMGPNMGPHGPKMDPNGAHLAHPWAHLGPVGPKGPLTLFRTRFLTSKCFRIKAQTLRNPMRKAEM